MKYKFVLVDTETGDTKQHWIARPPVTVGRDPTSEIIIDDPSISRRHCQFLIDPYGSLVVRDLDSKNGVYIDDRRVDKAIVPPKAELRIGLITLRVDLTDEDIDETLANSSNDTYDLAETQKVKIIRPDDDRYEIG